MSYYYVSHAARSAPTSVAHCVTAVIESSSSSFDADVSHQPDGRYRVSYVAPAAGVVHIHVTVKGVPIDGSPFAVNVLELAAFVTAEGDGLHAAIEDEVSKFEMVIPNAAAHPVSQLVLDAHLSGGGIIIHCTQQQRGLDTVEFSYTPSVVGEYNLEVTVNAAHIPCSPFAIVVAAAPIDATQCTVELTAESTATVGHQASCRLSTRSTKAKPQRLPRDGSEVDCYNILVIGVLWLLASWG